MSSSVAALIARFAKAFDSEQHVMANGEKAHLFGNVAEAHAFGTAHTAGWLPHLTPEHIEHIARYRACDSHAFVVNNSLRQPKFKFDHSDSPEYRKSILDSHRVLHDAISKAPPLQHGVVVHREVDPRMSPGGKFDPSTWKPGSVFHDPGFVSTALHSDALHPDHFNQERPYYDKTIHMAIHVPKGTPGAYLEHPAFRSGGYGDGLHELLLNRGSHFKVIHADPVKKHVVMELVHHHE